MDFEYSPADALDLLLKKLDDRQPSLAAEVRVAIDAGRDSVERVERGRRRQKAWEFRKATPFTDSEALSVAVQVLRAYFVEQPMFARSLLGDFAEAAVADQVGPVHTEGRDGVAGHHRVALGAGKKAVIEVKTETQRTETERETAPIVPPANEAIEEQQRNLSRLVELTTLPARTAV